jgi:hypothetical protein
VCVRFENFRVGSAELTGGGNPSKPQSCVEEDKTLAVCGFVSSNVICSVFFNNIDSAL